ncbi:hypothetical protein HK26_11790 [Acetobacter okinawensis]|uniref:Uncharacterized protein n=1 Tax=Acetobacter okinawensis TaxID=1076594 RepID=A0A252BVP7_9PROT|nr:hypothetical protein HK26_11790 [Acetobacter okinawensis]
MKHYGIIFVFCNSSHPRHLAYGTPAPSITPLPQQPHTAVYRHHHARRTWIYTTRLSRNHDQVI